MAATSDTPGRRRFAPALLSTVKDSFRLPPQQIQTGPAPELTPEPSPIDEEPPPLGLIVSRSAQPPRDREKRRFAPQLIETSRRCRRTGDTSPATRPTDKTDITPWTNHIYAPKNNHNHNHNHNRRFDAPDASDTTEDSAIDDGSSFTSSDEDIFASRDRLSSRRESMTADGLRLALEYERKEYARARKRREEEALMSAFPNYNPAKYETVEHFLHDRNSSEDEQDRRTKTEAAIPQTKRRRDSEVNWFAKEHQQHAEILQESRDGEGDVTDEDFESPGHEGPPAVPLWASNDRRDSLDDARGPMGEFFMPLIAETHVTPFIQSRASPAPAEPAPERPKQEIHPIGETFMPYIPSAPPGKAADMPYVPASTPFSRTPGVATPVPGRGADVGFRNVGVRQPKTKVQTPAMAGQDLKFRRCESPKHTKMEPDHPFFPEPGKELHRDPTGEKGLWMGYCLAKDSQEVMIPAELVGPHMIKTPFPPTSPNLVAKTSLNQDMCEEPARMWLHPTTTTSTTTSASSPSSTLAPPQLLPLLPTPATPAATRHKNTEAKGLHLVAGLDDRLKQEKERAELDEKIADEFGSPFVTQVYNYLSLGYPVMAQDYDYELSKISNLSVEDLRKDDQDIMEKGTMKLTMAVDERDGDRGPRWHALKKYVHEWARQHPNLSFDGPDPLHWGMRERRGSWAV